MNSVYVTAAMIMAVGVINFAVNHREEGRATSATSQIEFWEKVAGKKSPNLATLDNVLALELKNVVKTGGEATYVAAPGRYDGAIEAIGFNPFAGDFAGVDCNACGNLSASAQQKIALIRQGNFEQAVAAERQAQQSTGSRTGVTDTNFVVDHILIPLVFWQALLTLLVWREVRRLRHRGIKLSWIKDGSDADKYARSTLWMAPLYAVLTCRSRRKARLEFYQLANLTPVQHEELVQRIDTIDELLLTANGRDRALLLDRRDQLAKIFDGYKELVEIWQSERHRISDDMAEQRERAKLAARMQGIEELLRTTDEFIEEQQDRVSAAHSGADEVLDRRQ